MKPTDQNLLELAHQLCNIGAQLARKDVRTAIVQHHNDLQGNGLKAATTDKDGGRTANPTSQPETAALNLDKPRRTDERLAADIRTTIGQLNKSLTMLTQIQQAATTRPTPQPIQCPRCTPGHIHPGQTLCDNENCGTRSLKGECTNCGTTTNTAGPVKLRPIKGLCRPCYDQQRPERRKGNPHAPWFHTTQLLQTERVIETDQ